MSKYNLEKAKEMFSKKGYILLNNEFINVKTKMTAQDEEGYLIYTNLDKIVNTNNKPSLFHTNNPYSLYNISLWLKLNNKPYKLISDEYILNNTHLEFNCKKHGVFKMTWANMQSGYGCKKCSNKHISDINKHDFQKIKNEYMKNGFEVLDKEYKGTHSLMQIKNREGFIGVSKYSTYKTGAMPSFFAKYNPHTITNIKQWLKKNMPNLQLISNEYISSREYLIVKCNKHGIYKSTWENLKAGYNCFECAVEKRSGENAHNYNPNLSQEERERKRNFVGKKVYEAWRTEVFKRDGYKCVICNKREGALNAHHLVGWNWCKEKRVDIENGVTLCKKHHSDFHNIYKYGDNSKEQFEEYKKLKSVI